MSELPRQTIESLPRPNTTPETSPQPEKTPDIQQDKSVETPAVETIRQSVESQALSTEDITNSRETDDSQPAQIFGVQRELKAQAYKNTLQRTRQHLPVNERLFSKFIHSTGVERVSSALGNTIARPSGVISGALVALLGTSFVLYAAKHHGFTYNNAIFFLLFAGGFIVGILLELGTKLLSQRRSKV